MSDHNHEEHSGDDHHDHVPAVATEIVPENSFEDYSLIGLIVVCGLSLMVLMGSWMGIEQPSGGGHHDHGAASQEHSDAGAGHGSSHNDSSHSHH